MRLIDADELKRKIMGLDEKYDIVLTSMVMEAIEYAPTSDDGRIGVIDNTIERAQRSNVMRKVTMPIAGLADSPMVITQDYIQDKIQQELQR